MTVSEYIQLKYLIQDATGIYRNGQLFVIYEGREILDSEFRAMFPIPTTLYGSTENPNKKSASLC